MTQAVVVRRDGDAFQARMFWLRAARLLDPETAIVRVGFENGPKGYDDFWVDYDPTRGLIDQEGKPLPREHTQCKWHVAPNSYGHAELVDPEFINANARSLLERARAAQKAHAPQGEGARFRLLTNWRISRDDPLAVLVNNRSHTLRLDLLCGTATDNSTMGRVRKLWREHLGLTDDELRLFARTLAFSEATDSLDDLRDRLDPYFKISGLRRIPRSESAFVYDDVAFQWLAQGRVEFDRDTLLAACKENGLFVGDGEPLPKVFGVKSFEHATDRLEDRCVRVLNLVPNFLDRQIRNDADWATTLYPALKKFSLETAQSGDRLRLVLDAHLTLSFAAGSVLNIKSGRMIELEQRVVGKKIWSADDSPPDPAWPAWVFAEEVVHTAGTDLAVAICLTHAASGQVRSYLQKAAPSVGKLLVAQPSGGPGARSVVCGRHAFDLAEALTARAKLVCDQSSKAGRVHLFPACPGAFAFFLGQRQQAIGPVTLYEFDFDQQRDRSYLPSLSLPVART